MKKTVVGCFSYICCVGFFLISCSNPNPIYGQWIDNNGNKLVANTDFSFILTQNFPDETVTYEGVFAVYENTVTFTDSNGNIIVSEWDIRASVLHLLVPNPITGGTELLELYQMGK